MLENRDRIVMTGRFSEPGRPVWTGIAGVTAMTVARKERPDLILLDLGLPGGGGLLVLERLRAIAELAATPVIVVTARTDAAGEQDSRAAGAVDFLRKPVDAEQLAAAIERALG